MINNNNNFSDIGSMSASVYYGDGSNLTGVSGVSATMFNSSIAPADYGGLPWYKFSIPTISPVQQSATLPFGELNLSTINLVEGETINEVAIYCTTATASATASIALYSISLDANALYYPSNLLTTFGEVSLATTGRKTITGLSYIIPESLKGIYYIATLRTGGELGTASILGCNATQTLGYYGSLNSASQTRPITSKGVGTFSSFPATITSASFSTYTNSSLASIVGFR
jgi:hypothetical protein